MHTVFIEGTKVNLCVLEEKHVEGNYQNWLNDEIVCSGNSHYRYPVTKQQLLEYVNGINANTLVIAIIDKTSGNHIGNASLQRIDSINRTAEFAIILGEKTAWGKGIGKEVAYLLFNHGFTHLNLNRIYCGTFENNMGMIKIAEYLNMVKEGVRRNAIFKNGEYIDIVEYGLLKDEFKKM